MRRFLGIVLGISLMSAPSVVGTCFALDAAKPKQVLIESKFAEVSEAVTKEFMVYVPLTSRDGKGEAAFVITPLPDKKTKIEVTTLAYGQGADFRRWVPQNPQLTVNPEVGMDGFVKMMLRPESTDFVYVNKPSLASPVAPLLFAAIGSQYEAGGAHAASSPGQVCPVTGKPLSEGGSERGDIARSIDKAGMAAGMGLLTSQAKGQLRGQKSVFISDGPVTGFLFKTEAKNADKHELIYLVTPTIIKLNETNQ